MRHVCHVGPASILCLAAIASGADWTAEFGDWFDNANWDVSVPTASDTARINNDGTAQAVGAPGGESIEIGWLLVGARSGVGESLDTRNGHVIFTGADVNVVSTVHVGVHNGLTDDSPSDGIEARGSLMSENASLTTGVQLVVGALSVNQQSTFTNATANGAVTIEGTFTGSGVYAGTDLLLIGSSVTPGNVDMSGSRAIGVMTVSEGIKEQGNIVVAKAFAGVDWQGDDVVVNGDLSIASGGMIFSADGGRLSVGYATGSFLTAVGIIDVTGPIDGYDLVRIGTGTGDATTHVRGQLIARDSVITLDTDRPSSGMQIASKGIGTEDVVGVFELAPGFAQISNSEGLGISLGDEGTITLRIEGNTRANSNNIGTNGIYSAIDVDDAMLDGVIRADFDFTPPLEVQAYDLIVGDAVGALTSSMEAEDFQVFDLPKVFKVDFFGITEDNFGMGNVDVVRLAISPVPDTLPLDFDANGIVDVMDVDSLVGEIVAGSDDLAFDLSNDGTVDEADLTQWLAYAATENGFVAPYLFGDANLDGKVNVSDLNTIGRHWTQSVSRWSAGDFNADGTIDAPDLNSLGQNWHLTISSASPPAIPEPASQFLFGVGAIVVAVCLRSHTSRTRAPTRRGGRASHRQQFKPS